MKNFFISYNQADRQWAEWIAWRLEESGYTTTLQAWDFRPSENFVIKVDQAIEDSERIIAVLSPSYLNAQFAAAEWASAFRRDPSGRSGALLPVRVEECELKGLFSQIIYIDLLGKSESEAKRELLEGIKRERVKPSVQPGFPGNVPRSVAEHPVFPGRPSRRFPKVFLPMVLVSALIVITLWNRPFKSWLEPPQPCSRLEAGDYYEAEAADLFGDASKDTEHPGFSGLGYVSGYGHGTTATSTSFRVNVPSAGLYQVELCYANGTGSVKTLTIYLDEQRMKQTRLYHSERWNVWSTQTEFLSLHAGENSISYRKTPDDNGQVNLDFIRVVRQQ